MIKEIPETQLEEIAKLEKACFGDAWSASSIRDSLRQEWNHLLIEMVDDELTVEKYEKSPGNEVTAEKSAAQSPGHITGYVIYSLVSGEAELLRIATAPDARRRGIAQRLFHEMMTELRQEKAEKLFLEVRSGNAAAIGLYKNFGMKEIGRRKDYYRNPVEDALLFELILE